MAGGRPSPYEEIKDNLILVEGWARDGLTNEQIAHNLGVSVKTLYEWQKNHCEFRNALKRGKEVVDREVENALFKRAMGYEYEEVTKERITSVDGKTTEMAETKRVLKQVAPDVTAQIFWLKNRKPKEWRDKRETAITDADGGPLQVVFNIPRPPKEELPE